MWAFRGENSTPGRISTSFQLIAIRVMKDEKVTLNSHVRQFLDLIASNFELVSVSPEVASFCQSKFNITDRSQIEELLGVINKWLKSTASPESEIHRQIASTLSNHPDLLKKSIKQVIDQEGRQIKANLTSRSEQFMDTLQGSRCERVSGKEYVLELQVQIDPRQEEAAAALATRSFVLSEEQISGLLEDMERIREQLFRSLQTS